MQKRKADAHAVIQGGDVDEVGEGHYLAAGTLTLFESHACRQLVRINKSKRHAGALRTSPSKMPSPVVAQLGSTFQT